MTSPSRAALLALSLSACGSPLPELPARDLAPRATVGTLDDHSILDGGRLADGTRVLESRDGRLLPVSPETLPAPLQIGRGSRLKLQSGEEWICLVFADASGKLCPRWVSPTHGRGELAERRRVIADEAGRLPASHATRVQPLVPLIASVSVVEGSFDGIATHTRDPMASLGILQWAAPRKQTRIAGTSLGSFFATLQKRAQDGSDTLAASAWKQLRALGFDLRAGTLTLKGKPTSAGELEKLLAPELGHGALRSYQLVAAADYWESLSAPVSTRLYGPPARAALFSLGVNRPGWVRPALQPFTGRIDAIAFVEHALTLYPASDRERRARRLATALLVD
jgi:hypothetical protein